MEAIGENTPYITVVHVESTVSCSTAPCTTTSGSYLSGAVDQDYVLDDSLREQLFDMWHERMMFDIVGYNSAVCMCPDTQHKGLVPNMLESGCVLAMFESRWSICSIHSLCGNDMLTIDLSPHLPLPVT